MQRGTRTICSDLRYLPKAFTISGLKRNFLRRPPVSNHQWKQIAQLQRVDRTDKTSAETLGDNDPHHVQNEKLLFCHIVSAAWWGRNDSWNRRHTKHGSPCMSNSGDQREISVRMLHNWRPLGFGLESCCAHGRLSICSCQSRQNIRYYFLWQCCSGISPLWCRKLSEFYLMVIIVGFLQVRWDLPFCQECQRSSFNHHRNISLFVGRPMPSAIL